MLWRRAHARWGAVVIVTKLVVAIEAIADIHPYSEAHFTILLHVTQHTIVYTSRFVYHPCAGAMLIFSVSFQC